MNKIFRYALSLIAVSSLAVACSTDNGGSFANGIGDNAENAVYMGNSNASGVVSVLASDADGATFTVTPRLARIADEDIEVIVGVDKATLEEYNKQNNLSVSPINADDVIFTDDEGKEYKGQITVTIKKGEVQAIVPGRLASLDVTKYPYGGRYAIPVKILSVKEGARLLSSPQSTIVSLNRKIKTSVMHVHTNGATNGYTMKIVPNTAYTEEMSEWTLQYIAQFQSITGNNQTTASLSASKGFYNRISQTGGLQVKSEGRDGTDTWTNKPVNQGEWLHVSYVYRKQGLAGSLSVYVNGELQKTFTTSLMYVMSTADGWGFGNSNVNNYYLRELRFWKRALTPAEIVDKYYLPEDPQSEGLEAYFPFTKESYDATNKVFRDLTGKWTWSIQDNVKFDILENVVFPSTSFVQEP